MIEMKQEVSLRQQLDLTPQLLQALKLLQLTRLELEQELKAELETNPFLEEESVEVEVVDTELQSSTPAVASGGTERGRADKREEDPIESMAHREMGLHDYLLWQLGLAAETEQEIQIGETVIGNINDDGYLTSPVEDIASFTGAAVEDVDRVLAKIQDFDPSGVGARDLKECLLIQVRHLKLDGLQEDLQRVDLLIIAIITDHLAYLEKKDYASIAKGLNVPVDVIMTVAGIITRLNPKPGSVYSTGDENYIAPDVMVTRKGDKLAVEIIEEGLPRLRASDYYAKEMLSRSSDNDSARKFIREKLQGARWLIKAVEQRKKTIKKVVRAIVERQKSFFEYGEQYLEPMVLKDIAGDVGVHETTVGRVTNGKYVQTQWGMYELKYFFSPSLKTDTGDLLSTKLVKQKIKEFIEKEDRNVPLSDTDIVKVLKSGGIHIARRTVAKYRDMMNIPPVHVRRIKTL